MVDPKLTKTMDVFEAYEKRFAQARVDKKLQFPLEESQREDICKRVKKMLAYREELIPTVHNFTELKHFDFGTYDVIPCRYETWEKCYVSATLYKPHAEGKHPVAFVFHGHGTQGRLTESYRSMCHRLAECGFMVISPDNIGQGDREMMGHRFAHEPYYCGLNLQGMIIMESVALIRYMKNHPQADPDRMGSCGNSGAGTLNMFLCATAPELAAIVATGYPSEFHYVLSKERRHCTCNLIPGCCSSNLDMWEILSARAPKPLMIEQGLDDNLIPVDYFLRASRKIDYVYEALGVPENFRHTVAKNIGHSWTDTDIAYILEFLTEKLGVPYYFGEKDSVKDSNWEDLVVAMPEDARTTAQVAEAITGIKIPENLQLQDLFPPMLNNEKVDPDTIIADLGRGETMRIWAQMECVLKED